MLSKKVKEKLFVDYESIFKTSALGVLLEYNGLTVGEMTEMRKELHKQGSEMKVLKNRVAKKASLETPFEQINEQFVSMRILVFNKEDIISPAKYLAKEVKDHPKLELVGGIMISGDRADALDPEQIKALGNLPSREELLVKLLFLMNAPITSFVRTLNEVPASFARVLNSISETK